MDDHQFSDGVVGVEHRHLELVRLVLEILRSEVDCNSSRGGARLRSNLVQWSVSPPSQIKQACEIATW